jgi:hypothetical protein
LTFLSHILVCESSEIWIALGVRRWERALQSTIGFGPAPAALFRPTRKLGSGRCGKEVLSIASGTVGEALLTASLLPPSSNLQTTDNDAFDDFF